MTKYKARTGAPFNNEKAQEIGEYIEKIKVKTTENILKKVKKDGKKSPLFEFVFNCNKKEAAHRYRLQRIRKAIECIVLDIKKSHIKIDIRAFHSIRKRGKSGPEYVSLNIAFSDKYLKDQIISRALTELENWTVRYERYSELGPITVKIKDFIKKNGKKKKRKKLKRRKSKREKIKVKAKKKQK
jgi:hypothetical protein